MQRLDHRCQRIVAMGVLWVLMFAWVASAQGQPSASATRDLNSDARSESPSILPFDDAMIVKAMEHILSVQEGDGNAEWPYEGVYRVGGEIPIGYRVGGTGICAMALILAPGYEQDKARQEAVLRAVKFIVGTAKHPLMAPGYSGGYDVRGWGYTYGLTFLLRLKSSGHVPEAIADEVESIIAFFIDAIQKTEITQVGGWNYSRAPGGLDKISPPSPFMTAPTLQALFEASALGYAVDSHVVDRALSSLERARTPTGSFRYAGVNGRESKESIPGSIGRMVAAEATLALAGRSDVSRVRSAVDAFIVHWEWLEKRRRQNGTHVKPYGIAPYYFFYAHYYAAQAVEMLPEHERAEYRRRINERLLSIRDADGTWNDRVFERSSNYGSAMAIMSLLAPEAKPPAPWRQPEGPTAKH